MEGWFGPQKFPRSSVSDRLDDDLHAEHEREGEIHCVRGFRPGVWGVPFLEDSGYGLGVMA